MKTAAFKVWRSDPAGGHYEDYSVEVVPGMVVLDAIHQIQATQAPDMAVRWNCKAGKCGSCSAEINGNPRLMCMTRLNTLNLFEPISVEPMRAFPPRKADAPDGTWRMQQRDVDRVQEFRKCIECFLCQDVCHVLRDHKMHDQFIGPRFLTYAAALEMNPLDAADRVPALREQHGIGYCNITRCCTKVFLKDTTITENAIIPLKERVVDRYYDPVKKLLRVFRT